MGAKSTSEVPEFTSDRLRLLGPLLTPDVLALALNRVKTSESFFYKNKLRDPNHNELTVKLALMIALEINPREHLDNHEEGVLRGIGRDTVAKLKQEGAI